MSIEKNTNLFEKVTWKPGTMIFPLPVVMVTCGDMKVEYNVLTIAWTGITCTDPPMCYISVRPERYSYGFLEKYREFGINLTNKELAFATDWCGVKSGRDVDKFKKMKLTPFAADIIKAPLIAESPVNLECVVREIKPLGSHHMFLAEIVAVHAAKIHLDPKTGAFNLSQAKPICYSHGKYYQSGSLIGKFGFSVEKKKKKRRPIRG
ncbi:MAG TPA: flavin reductase family protein [Candidatus Kapabacteria bacterium]|nr:flavin reductase family protein [Candidatus Kapabacteria bacterium]